ncbi:MAG TPA: glycerophosphodiester phosphodiesterase [Gemmatimonadales bacterium]|nr:glycerophosphodiester phosphodiesterase [Gemmatimonadales bacterium]
MSGAGPGRPLVIAHRGASAREVENSLAAFRAAGPLGADGVELDVHATSDGGLIVHHDEAIAGRPIPSLTTAQVASQRLPNGEPVPTLGAALAALGPRLSVFVEVKSLPPQFDDRLLEALDGGPNPRGYAVHGFDHRIVARLGRERPALVRGVLSSSYPINPLTPLRDAGATILWQERSLVDRPLAAALHSGGMRLFVWTVDDPGEMRRLLELGADGICTNHPELGRQAVDALGERAPA